MLQRMKAWFDERAEREQRTLLLGAIALLVILLWMLFWQPLLSERRSLTTARNAAIADLQWMQQATGRVQSARTRTRSAINASPEVTLSRGAARYGLVLSRMEPAGRNRIEVIFESANYTQLIRYIAELEQTALTVDRLSLQKTEPTGYVQARLRMTKE